MKRQRALEKAEKEAAAEAAAAAVKE